MKDGYTQTLEASVVIVGGGVSGVIAALNAAEHGLKNIVLMEKMNSFGGAGNGAQGFYALNSVLQQGVENVPDVEKEFKSIMESSSYTANSVLIRRYLEESKRSVTWLIDHGLDIRLGEVQQLAHDYGRAYHRWNHIRGRFNILLRQLEQYDITLLRKTCARRLIRDENGAVCGVAAESGEGPVLVRAKAVVIATGGYIDNTEMVQAALGDPYYEEISFRFKTQYMGEGIQMAWDAGAAHADDKVLICHALEGQYMDKRNDTSLAFLNIPILWVNKSGKRFIGEDMIFESTCFGNVVRKQGCCVFSVADQATVDLFKRERLPYEMAQWDLYVKDGSHFHEALSRFDEQFAQMEQAGCAWRCDTLEELAEKIGVPAAEFSATVARYNGFVEAGRDDEYFKDPKYLKLPVKTGPFYAFKGCCLFLNTVGGVRIDEHFRALNSRGDIVPGLYVIGADAGGMYPTSYVPREGFALGFSIISAILCSEELAERL